MSINIILRISDELYQDWWDLMKTKKDAEQAEVDTKAINTTMDNNVKSNAVALEHWNGQISNLQSEKKALEDKLVEINSNIDGAEVNMLNWP